MVTPTFWYMSQQQPVLHVVCDNPECFWVGQIRRVPLAYLRQGVYAKPTGFVCECGQDCRETAAPEPVPARLIEEFDWAHGLPLEPPC